MFCIIPIPRLHIVHMHMSYAYALVSFGLWQNPLIFNNFAFLVHIVAILI